MSINKIESSIISFGGGCFWCVEGIFSTISGVLSTQIGYGGGSYPYPTYTTVSSNPDGHAELTIVKYDQDIISLAALMEVFFALHNPNKTFTINDKKGELYRSVIMYNSENQKSHILEIIAKYEKNQNITIGTEVLPLVNFKLADEKYQNYFSSNPQKPFCKNVIGPKIAKLRANGII